MRFSGGASPFHVHPCFAADFSNDVGMCLRVESVQGRVRPDPRSSGSAASRVRRPSPPMPRMNVTVSHPVGRRGRQLVVPSSKPVGAAAIGGARDEQRSELGRRGQLDQRARATIRATSAAAIPVGRLRTARTWASVPDCAARLRDRNSGRIRTVRCGMVTSHWKRSKSPPELTRQIPPHAGHDQQEFRRNFHAEERSILAETTDSPLEAAHFSTAAGCCIQHHAWSSGPTDVQRRAELMQRAPERIQHRHWFYGRPLVRGVRSKAA